MRAGSLQGRARASLHSTHVPDPTPGPSVDCRMLLLAEIDSKEDSVPWKRSLAGPVYYRLIFKPMGPRVTHLSFMELL